MIWRLLAYTGGVGLLGGALNLYARHGDLQSFMDERSLIEYGQQSLLAVAMGVLFLRAWGAAAPRRLVCVLAGLLAALALVREHNNQLERFEPWLGWKALALVLLGAGGIIAWRGRRQLGPAIMHFAREQAFVLLWAGFATILYAQMFGHGGFLEPLFGDHYIRAYKRVIEEGLELFGYFLIFCGSLEMAVGEARGGA